jgi:hypothetical protein
VIGLVVEAGEKIEQRFGIEVPRADHPWQNLDHSFTSSVGFHAAFYKIRCLCGERQQVIRPTNHFIPPLAEIVLIAGGRVGGGQRRPPGQSLELEIPFAVVDFLALRESAPGPVDAGSAVDRRKHILVAAKTVLQCVVGVEAQGFIEFPRRCVAGNSGIAEVDQQLALGIGISIFRRSGLHFLQAGVIQIQQRQHADDSKARIAFG